MDCGQDLRQKYNGESYTTLTSSSDLKIEEATKRVSPFSKSNQNIWRGKILFLPFYIQLWEDDFLFLLLYLRYFQSNPYPSLEPHHQKGHQTLPCVIKTLLNQNEFSVLPKKTAFAVTLGGFSAGHLPKSLVLWSQLSSMCLVLPHVTECPNAWPYQTFSEKIQPFR